MSTKRASVLAVTTEMAGPDRKRGAATATAAAQVKTAERLAARCATGRRTGQVSPNAKVLADAARPELLAKAASLAPEQFAREAGQWAAKRQDDGGEADFRRLRRHRPGPMLSDYRRIARCRCSTSTDSPASLRVGGVESAGSVGVQCVGTDGPVGERLALDPRGFRLVVGVRGRVGPGPWVVGFLLGCVFLGAVLELDEGHLDLRQALAQGGLGLAESALHAVQQRA